MGPPRVPPKSWGGLPWELVGTGSPVRRGDGGEYKEEIYDPQTPPPKYPRQEGGKKGPNSTPGQLGNLDGVLVAGQSHSEDSELKAEKDGCSKPQL